MTPLADVPFNSSHLRITDHFIAYKGPLLSTIIIGLMLVGLSLPVGAYFLKAATHQIRLKGKITSLILGLVHIGILNTQKS